MEEYWPTSASSHKGFEFRYKSPFSDKLAVGFYSFGRKNEDFSTEFVRLGNAFLYKFPFSDKLAVGNYSFGQKNENFS